jgi:hypothetical protein
LPDSNKSKPQGTTGGPARRSETPFSTGFRVHKQLRALVQAHALYRGHAKVKMEDFEEIRRLSKFMNLDFHEI